MTPAKRLAVIGGGMGGVATAWLCDFEWEVSVFETKEKLGGNCDSETIHDGRRDVVVDLGAQFFHPETHPTYVALLELLELRSFEIAGSLSVVPLDGSGPAFSSTNVARTPRHALDFAVFSYASRKMAATGDYDITIASWVAGLPVSESFRAQILLPWLTASEGHPLLDTKRSSARAILELFAPTQPKSPWKKSRLFSPRNGFQGAITALAQRCANAHVHTQSRIQRIEKTDDGWYVYIDGARSGPFDAVVVNAPPWESKKLLAESAWAADLVAVLDRFQHLSHRLTIHDDPTYVHADRKHWALANVGIAKDGHRSELSIWYGAAFAKIDDRPIDLFKSWTTNRDHDPRRVRFERSFQHSIKTPMMMDASRQLRSWQGREGLWFVGQFMSGIDLQESALRSAMDVSRALSPRSPNLVALERRRLIAAEIDVFTALAGFIFRRRRFVLVCSTLFLVAATAMVARGGALTGGTFGGGEAEQAEQLIAQVLGHPSDTTFLAVFHHPTLAPRDPAFRVAMEAVLARIAKHADVRTVTTPYDAPDVLAPQLVNDGAHSAIAFIDLRGSFKQALSRYAAVREQLRPDGDLEITCTGRVPFMHDFDRVVSTDVLRAELISLPLVLLVLLMAFRTGVAALLPAGVGALAVVGGMAVVLGLSNVMDIAEYAINVCSLIGLGVAVDYSLFTVSRYREELEAGHDYPEALARALDGAGRVVAFSGFTLFIGLSGLLFFEGSFLFAMGVAGIAVVSLAVVFALTFLPALLAVLGPKIHALALPMGKPAMGESIWRRTATWVMRHPIAVLVPTLTLIGFMGSPFLRLQMTEPDVRVLDRGQEARRGYELMKRDFSELASNRIVVAVRFPSTPALTPARVGALFDFAARARALPHVRRVESIVSAGDHGRDELQRALIDPPPAYRDAIEEAKKMTVGERVVLVYALSDSAPESRAAQELVRALRKDRAVADGTVFVGGQTAADMDATEFVREKTPRAIGFVMVATFVVLFFLFGSVVLPIKAIVMNLLSVVGSFGALVWVFQEGHLGLSEPRPVEHALPVLLFCVLFGLSMDYEVLVLSRIKESYERSRDNTLAIADGLDKTARLFTSAAAIMIVVFAAFVLARIVLLRAVGFGMAFAVFIDATLVRLLLVPATMRLFGRFNWWAPRSLQKLRAMFGLH